VWDTHACYLKAIARTSLLELKAKQFFEPDAFFIHASSSLKHIYQ
jgi:hypothetical protein